MPSNATVVQRSITATKDAYGDVMTVPVESTWEWALIAPRTSTERAEPHAPAVVIAATIYGPGGKAIGPDDLLIVSGHSPSLDGEWQVEGIAGDWKYAGAQLGVEVAVKRIVGVA